MPDRTIHRTAVAAAIKAFGSQSLAEASRGLFNTLGYRSDRRVQLGSPALFMDQLDPGGRLTDDERQSLLRMGSIDLVFQLTNAELEPHGFLFEDRPAIDPSQIESYLLICAEISQSRPTRTELSTLVRTINKPLPMPAIVVFRHGDAISLGIIHRRTHRRDAHRDVLEKVTLIKDIRVHAPHRAHVDILADLAIESLSASQPCGEPVRNFLALHKAWQATLDIQSLNRRFFIEVRNWFYWARHHSRFPDGARKDADKRDSESVLRLLTRMIFCWFLREKGMVPEDLFDPQRIRLLLEEWTPDDSDGRGRYYKAILQNLFFATLGTPVADRKFRSPRVFKGVNKHYGDQHFFRHVALFASKAPVEDLYKSIPFLNGGLFENLDEFPGEDNDLADEVRVDGFSDVETKQPIVPDFLFFGTPRAVPEISDLLGESSAPSARGLILILRDYKFTVEENTPLEQDIALDPELLGLAFENLLAAVNPETGTVARKSTGSFYTPREIVQYMVEESLVRYLLHGLDPGSQDPDLANKLRELVSEQHPSHRLQHEEQRIVDLIGRLRILDPACGSGAFPMGLLNLLVHVLRKVDPMNKLWEEAKLAQLPPEMRDKTRAIFQSESWDYTRKLELIKDCIHGVDIQPAAIQIAKLRFFLSLVIEQPHPSAVRPLPNLETKFVCANALLGIPRPKDWDLFQHQIEPKEQALLATRTRFFFAQSKREKDACKADDRRLRRDLSQFIKATGGSAASHLASAVASWDPYHSDRRAPYFDPESMFGIRDGFDITIGNPPFVRADEPSEWNRSQRNQILESGQYETLWEKWDLYIPFIERSFKLLRHGGVSSLIVSDAFCHSKYAIKPQLWYLKHARILRLDFCGDLQIFDAAVHNVIHFFQKADPSNHIPERRLHQQTFGSVLSLPSDLQSNLNQRAFFPSIGETMTFDCETILLDAICYISVGMVVHADEKRAKGAFQLEDLVARDKDGTHPKPFVEGKHLNRWLPGRQMWLEWGTERSPCLLRRPTFEELYSVDEKLISVDMAASIDRLRVAYDNAQLFHNHSAWSFVPWHALRGVQNNSIKKVARYPSEKPPRPDLPNRTSLEDASGKFAIKYLLGIMNSGTARDYLRANRRSNIHIYPDDWKKLPVPDVGEDLQAPVVRVVGLILALQGYLQGVPEVRKAVDTVQMEFLEGLNDALARELYHPEELHGRGLHFGRMVMESGLPDVVKIQDEAQLDAVRRAIEKAYDIQTPLRAALFDLASMDMTDRAASET